MFNKNSSNNYKESNGLIFASIYAMELNITTELILDWILYIIQDRSLSLLTRQQESCGWMLFPLTGLQHKQRSGHGD